VSRSSDSALITVLFTDIVGSTQIAGEMGDRRWRALLDGHHGTVRAQLRRFGGREVDTAGDGFLATFDRPGNAVRCAFAICQQVRTLGIEIRAGLHVGEVARRGQQVTGIAINTGARIAALAGPGEILVSGTIRELLPGSGISFEDRGTRELKGVPEPQRIAAVTSVDNRRLSSPLGPAQAMERREAITVPERRERRRVSVAILVASIILTTITAGLVLISDDDPERRHPAPVGSGVVRIDPETSRVTGRIQLPVPTSTFGGYQLAAGEGSLWTASALVLTHVDPATGETQRIQTGHEALRLAIGHRAAWVAGQTDVSVINAATLEEDEMFPIVEGQQFVLPIDTSRDAVWAGSGNSLIRIGPAPPYPIQEFDVGISVDEISAGPDGIWVVDVFHKTLALFDPRTESVVQRQELQSQPDDVDVAPDGTVWILSSSAGTLSRLSPLGNLQDPNPVGTDPSDVVATGDAVWIADTDARTVVRVDPLTGTVADRIGLSGPVMAIAADTEAVWALVA
jgi:class 3 adenylate cyclase